ncbi:MAG: NRDE family protein [Bacteroidetes bacterium]|nr:NRDE family protein [Bacteroidota bacterium]
MCTLSTVPANNKLIFTFNRDESPFRDSTPPQIFIQESFYYLAPVDLIAYGTWLGISNTGILIFLMNGAFVKHKRQPKYRHSRGVIIPEFFNNGGEIEFIDTFDLNDIEPFTLIIYKDKKLYHFVWDGQKKFWNELSPSVPHLFSSATLYSPQAKEERRKWFMNELIDLQDNHASKILNLHQRSHSEKGFRYPGTSVVETVSTSQIIVAGSGAAFDYYDFILGRTIHNELTWKKIMH